MLSGRSQDTVVSLVTTQGYEMKLHCMHDLALQTSDISLLDAQQLFFPAVPVLG